MAPNARRRAPVIEQSSLPGFDPAPEPTDRLFFALFPDAPAAERIARLARGQRSEHGLHGQPLLTERLHVTLHHVGDHAGLPADVVAQAGEAAASLAVPAFELAFDRVVSFRKARQMPFVLRGAEGASPLMDFQAALGTALKKAGLGCGSSPDVPCGVLR